MAEASSRTLQQRGWRAGQHKHFSFYQKQGQRGCIFVAGLVETQASSKTDRMTGRTPFGLRTASGNRSCVRSVNSCLHRSVRSIYVEVRPAEVLPTSLISPGGLTPTRAETDRSDRKENQLLQPSAATRRCGWLLAMTFRKL